MMDMLANNVNIASLIVPSLVSLCIIAVCITVFSIMTWNVEPWTRKYLKPHKQLRADRYRVKIMKLRAKYPDVFKEPSPFVEQHFDLEDAVSDVKEIVEGDK